MKLLGLVATAVLAAAPLAVNASTLIDGSFETKGAATPVSDYCYNGFGTPGGPACAASPWTGAGTGVIISNSGPWGGTAAVAGTYYGFVQGLGAVTQTFTATDTKSLQVTWLDAGRKNNGGPQTYTVTVNDGISSVLLGTYSTNGGVFTARSSASFLATAGTAYTLSFTGLATDDRTSFIDNVALDVVPEPATWGLMLAGFGLVGYAARRRRSALAI